MSRILVPIDFSKTSMAALHYALHFAAVTDGKLTLIHVVKAGFTAADMMMLDTLDAAMDSARNRLGLFWDEYTKQFGDIRGSQIPERDVRFGVAGFTISDVANDLDYDYVVTGMRDNHSFTDKMLGTTSAIIVKNSNCPVILIHEDTRWQKPGKIIFTIDHQTDFDESVSDFCAFNNAFKASTDFIHIRKPDDNDFGSRDAVLHELFIKNPPAFSFSIKSITGGDVIQSIVDYTIFEKADLIVMVHRKKGFLDSVFRRSVSLTTAEGIHLPVMILAETPPEA